MHTYVHTYTTHAYIRTYIDTYTTHAYIHTHIHNKYIRTYIDTYTTHAYIRTYVHMLTHGDRLTFMLMTLKSFLSPWPINTSPVWIM